MQHIQTLIAQKLGMPRGKEGSQAVRLKAVGYSEKKTRKRLIKASQSAKWWLDRLAKAREEVHLWGGRLYKTKGMEEPDILDPEAVTRFERRA